MKIFRRLILLFILTGVQFSCTDYLDKAATADISDEEVFESFRNFQGFVETLYADVVNFSSWGDGTLVKNFGDDVSPRYPSHGFVDGDYRKIFSRREYQFYNTGARRSRAGTRNAIWQNGWMGIRYANIGLAHIDDLVEATDNANALLTEQKNLIAGQCYFFRAYLHLEFIRAWGDIPYINQPFSGEIPEVPQLGLYNTMDSVIRDLDKAIELLPVDWNEIATGQLTLNQNIGRATKGTALAVKAICLMYAASPLFNGTVTGNYVYNTDYAKRSAEAAWEVIKLANEEGVYALEPWETYSNIFYRWDGIIAKSKEHILTEVKNITISFPWL